MSTRYEQMADALAQHIDQGVFEAGERLPGVRKLAQQFGVSVSTAVQAQQVLESRGYIEARPRSGFFVRVQSWQTPSPPLLPKPSKRPTIITGQNLAMKLSQVTHQTGIVQLGAAVPNAQFLPTRAVNQSFIKVAKQYPQCDARYMFPPGSLELRRQISRRMTYAGCQIAPDELVITSGCQEALMLCLRAVSKPGDIVAIESPSFYGLLQVIESLGLKALEIPTDPQSGISLSALQLAIEQWPLKACIVVSNFSNPLGHCLSDESKKQLVQLLSKHTIPLIEDDVYGDLAFDQSRPLAAKHYDNYGDVLYCASFSKTISPGLRVGWIAPGRFQEQIEYQKYISSLASPGLPQLALADFLSRGGYDKHLRQVRQRYAQLVQQFSRAIIEFFPEGTRLTQPAGGFVLWVELPGECDSVVLYQQAMEHGVSIAPGIIFSAKQKYRNFIRLNCAQPWNRDTELAVLLLGKLANKLAK
ncbi:MAG: PLP-dependent aminotransferase family protein [Gammaproteobacteria bacterium]|nr:PLP-dependent aminotransferase family protein [Gammaproteobacteria bacterium]